MTHASVFSGIGGFDLAARNVGITNVFQVEIDEFCQKVLAKNFPETEKYRNIYEFNGAKYNGAIDIISGGFPCQPFSVAGKRKGTADDRYLWDEMFRVVCEVRPNWVIAENVEGLIANEQGLAFEKCFSDLESAGYDAEAFIIPAIAKNAPHRRNRVWIVANIDSERLQGASGLPNGFAYGNRGEIRWWRENWLEVAAQFCRVDNGVSDRVDRIKSLGNAIVPQVAEEIFKAIIKTEEMKKKKRRNND